jgi:hypothetical protein
VGVDLAFSPGPGLKATAFLVLFLFIKLMRAPDSRKNPMYGAAESLDWESVHLQNLSAKNVFA